MGCNAETFIPEDVANTTESQEIGTTVAVSPSSDEEVLPNSAVSGLCEV